MRTVDGWHIVDGKWRHIIQDISESNTIQYYTDGKLEAELELDKGEKNELAEENS